MIVEGGEFHFLSLKFFISNFFLRSLDKTESLFNKKPVASTIKFDAKLSSTSKHPKLP